MINKIVACIDDSPLASIICDWAGWLSQRLDSDVVLLHVLEKTKHSDSHDYSGNLGFDSRENLLEELVELDAKRAKIELAQGKILLEHAQARVRQQSERLVTTLQRHEELLPAVQAQLTDNSILVLGKQGSSGDEFGSHLERITRQVSQPILIVPNIDFSSPVNIMLAYDGKDIAKRALDFLAHSPLSDMLNVHVVMIGDYSQDELNFPAMTFIEASKNADVKRYPAPKDDKALTETLLEHAKTHNINILTIGAYGNSALRRLFLGSTTLDILQHTDIPTLLLR